MGGTCLPAFASIPTSSVPPKKTAGSLSTAGKSGQGANPRGENLMRQACTSSSCSSSGSNAFGSVRLDRPGRAKLGGCSQRGGGASRSCTVTVVAVRLTTPCIRRPALVAMKISKTTHSYPPCLCCVPSFMHPLQLLTMQLPATFPPIIRAPSLPHALHSCMPHHCISAQQRKLSMLRKKLWKEAGPPPDLATRLFSERIMYLVSVSH